MPVLADRTAPSYLPHLLALRMMLPRPGRPHGLPGPLVVSLTSHPPRFPTLVHTLRSLLLQRTRPDRVELCVAADTASALPSEVSALTRHGLTIRTHRELGPYLKYVPLRLAEPGAYIVTADDDVFYPAGWLGKLIAAHRIGVREVVCHRAHGMRRATDGRPLPYFDWEWNIPHETEGPHVFPTGVGGVLYPPGVHGPDIGDDPVFMELCPRADDIWLYWKARLGGVTLRKIGPAARLTLWDSTQQHGLWNANRREGTGNDRWIAAMYERFGLPG